MIAAALAAVFVVIAVEAAVGGPVVRWDQQVTQLLAAGRAPAWDRVLWFFSLLGNTYTLVMLTVATVLLLLRWGRPMEAVFVSLTMASASGLSQLLKAVLARPRPPQAEALIALPGSHSLPSGHALMTAVFVGLLLVFALRSRRPVLRPVAVVLGVVFAALVGMSRVYLGVHWLSDVIGGWCLAGVWLILALGLFRIWERSRFALHDGAPGLPPWRGGLSRVLTTFILAAAVVAVLVVEGLTDPLLG